MRLQDIGHEISFLEANDRARLFRDIKEMFCLECGNGKAFCTCEQCPSHWEQVIDCYGEKTRQFILVAG